MSFELIVTTDADRDIEVARLWYDEQQEGIGLKFIIAVRLRFWGHTKNSIGAARIRPKTNPQSYYPALALHHLLPCRGPPNPHSRRHSWSARSKVCELSHAVTQGIHYTFDFTFKTFPAQCAAMERLFLMRVGGALAIVVTLLLAGCASSNIGTSVTDVPSASSSPAPTPVAKPVASTVPSPVVTKPPTNPPVAITKPATAPAAPPVALEPEPIHGWIGIDRWARANGARVHVVATGAQPKLELMAPAGRLEFSVGSQFAKWNGESFLLGFAPQIIGHEISVNGLDISKSFIPLLQPRATTLRGRTIVIDPGHGGDQRGTKSVVSKQFEKDFTLDWALRLQTLLSSNGWHVYLTRTNDSDVPLQNRVAVADRVNADLFVSLHFNSGGGNGAESGVETYCMTPFGMPANLTRGYVDDPYYNWPNNAMDRENFTWAMRLHRAVIGELKANDRGVRRARFMAVLRTQRRPAVLIEGGYLSNRHEATLINMADYRQKLAQAVADGLGTFPKQ